MVAADPPSFPPIVRLLTTTVEVAPTVKVGAPVIENDNVGI